MKKSKIIGTDVSLKVCKQEGYMMLDTEGHKRLDVNHQYRVFCQLPSHMQEQFVKTAMGVDTICSWKDVQSIYLKHKEDIDRFDDNMPAIMGAAEPSLYDLLRACDTIHGYCGLP